MLSKHLVTLLGLTSVIVFIAIPIVVRYRVLGFEESGVRSQDSGFRIQDSGVKILVYLMRLGNAIILFSPLKLNRKFIESLGVEQVLI
jgi:hypothetical protein